MSSLHPDTCHAPKHDQGFTLLELMVSITLIILIVLVMAGALRLGSRSVNACDKRAEALERYRNSLYLIDSQIQSYVPLTIDDNGVKKSPFKGDNKSITFTTNYSIWGGTRGYVAVTYKVESSEQGKEALYASENTVGMENRREAKLFDHCTDISIDYYFKGIDEAGKWIEPWVDEQAIPEKVRFNLQFGTKKLSYVVPVRVTGRLTTTTPTSQVLPE